MWLAKLGGLAVAILLAAMNGLAKADLMIEMDVAGVNILTGSGGTIDSATQQTYYNSSTFATSGSLGFNSLLPVGSRVQITMSVYADILDAAHEIANYSYTESYGNGSGLVGPTGAVVNYGNWLLAKFFPARPTMFRPTRLIIPVMCRRIASKSEFSKLL